MNTIFDIPKQTTVSDPINYWVGKKFKPDKEMLSITVDINSPAYKSLWRIAKENFQRNNCQQAFVKAYYLYLFLIKIADLGDNIFTSDISSSLSVSQNSRKEIDKVLNYHGLLVVTNKSDYYKSKKQMIEAKKYGEAYNIEHYKYKLYYYPCEYSATSLVRSRKLTYTLSQRLWRLLDSRGFTLHDPEILCEALSKRCIFENIGYSEKVTYSINGREMSTPSYQDLSISPTLLSMRVKQVKQKVRIFGIMDWLNNKHKPVKFQSGRLYHAFHYTPKELRPYMEYKGSALVELLDIKNAFFVFLSKAFRVSATVNNLVINQVELNNYERLTRDGHFYEDVMGFEGEWIRDVVKERLNAFKNDNNTSMCHYPEHKYFEANFPGILNVLKHYPTYIGEDGNEIKFIQKDAAYIETYIMSSVCKELQELGVTPFSLHDAIYVSKDDQRRLAEMGIDAKKIFWEKYDSMTDEDTISLIQTCRNTPNTLS